MWIDLAVKYRFHSGSLEAEVEPTDSGKKRRKTQRHLVVI